MSINALQRTGTSRIVQAYQHRNERRLMIFYYELTVDDLVEASRHFQPTERSLADRSYEGINRAALFVLIAITLYAAVLTSQAAIRIAILTVVVAVLAAPRLLWWFEGRPDRQRLSYAAPGNELLYGSREFQTSDAGFVIKGERSEHRYPWTTVWRLELTPEYALVFIAPILIHAVPLRRLQGENRSEQLLAELLSRVPSDRVVRSRDSASD
jgi:hypothetical protein